MRASRVLARLRDSESGVAMVTVLFVAAALTAVSSGAAFVTVQEFRAGRDDRKATEAVAYAEAGIDRMMLELRRGHLTWGEIREAGCAVAPLEITGPIGNSNGSFRSVLTVYDLPTNTVPTTPWTLANDAQAPCTARASGAPKTLQYFAITSTGEHPAAKRVIRQVIGIGLLGLPVGIFAESCNANANPSAINITMFCTVEANGRGGMKFQGLDPFYTVGQFWTGNPEASKRVPAAMHSLGAIYLGSGLGQNAKEHPGPLNCTANGLNNGQSLWDQSGRGLGGPLPSGQTCSQWVPPSGGPTGPPADSELTQEELSAIVKLPTLSEQDLLTLRDTAKQTGLHCTIPTVGLPTCTVKGGQPFTLTGAVDQNTVNSIIAQQRDFVAYFDFQDRATAATNKIQWLADVSPCADPPSGTSAVLIARFGGLDLRNGGTVNGALFAPEGEVDLSGSGTFEGSISAKTIRWRNTAYSVTMTDCWVRNMPGPYLDVNPVRWMELDR